MKVNPQNTVTCGLTKAEVKMFEAWGTAMGYNINQALKKCIRYTVEHLAPEKPAVEPVKPLETV